MREIQSFYSCSKHSGILRWNCIYYSNTNLMKLWYFCLCTYSYLVLPFKNIKKVREATRSNDLYVTVPVLKHTNIFYSKFKKSLENTRFEQENTNITQDLFTLPFFSAPIHKTTKIALISAYHPHPEICPVSFYLHGFPSAFHMQIQL